jgi:hypothetical protein
MFSKGNSSSQEYGYLQDSIVSLNDSRMSIYDKLANFYDSRVDIYDSLVNFSV